MTQWLEYGEYTLFDENILHIIYDMWYTMLKYHLQEELKMSVQRLHAFEKTSIQTRHTIKRLEMFIETTRNEMEKSTAIDLLNHFKSIREYIPAEFQDVDLKERE